MIWYIAAEARRVNWLIALDTRLSFSNVVSSVNNDKEKMSPRE
jgi:hypothetical protein